jgi:magnesium transporter
MEELSMEIAELEQRVIHSPTIDVLTEVTYLKSEVQRLRQIVWPQRELISRLAHGQFKIVRAHMLPYYRDLLDQLVRITDLTDTYRDSLTNILQIHLNFQQAHVNQVIKVLTVLATLAMPMLIVTSFYGMNVQHWPTMAASTAYAYYWVFGVTGVSTLFVFLYLKRRGWW